MNKCCHCKAITKNPNHKDFTPICEYCPMTTYNKQSNK